MRKIIVCTVLFVLLFIYAPPTAVAEEVEQWEGQTSQGLPVYLTLFYPDEKTTPIVSWTILFNLVCQESSSTKIWGFSSGQEISLDKEFMIDAEGDSFFFEWRGILVSGEGGGGYASFTSAVLYSVESPRDVPQNFDAEKCFSGPVIWEVAPVVETTNLATPFVVPQKMILEKEDGIIEIR